MEETKTPPEAQKITFEQLMLMAPAFVPPAVMPMIKQMEPVLKKKFEELSSYPGRIVEMERKISDLEKVVVELVTKPAVNFDTKN